MISDLLDAQFSTAVVMVNAGASPVAAASALLDEWGAPALLRKADGPEDPEEPGSHGQPEIARQEKAFYDSLDAGRKRAYDDLMDMVHALFRRRKPFESVDVWRADEPIDAWKRRAFRALIEQPARAFMLGQLLADDFLEGAKKQRPLMPTDRRAIEYLKAYTFSEISAKFDAMKGTLRHALIEGVEAGRNPKEVARLLAAELNDYKTDLKLIAITETARAENQGRLHELRDRDIKHVVWSSAFDARRCDWCEKMEGKIFWISSVVGKSNYGRRKKDWIPGVAPAHPRCRCLYLPFIGSPAEARKAMREQALAML